MVRIISSYCGSREMLMKKVLAGLLVIFLFSTVAKGKTALMLATFKGHTEIVQLLYNQAIELKPKDAAAYKNIEIAQGKPGDKQATVPLYESNMSPLVHELGWSAMQNISRVPPAQRAFIKRQVQAVMVAGQKVIRC